MEAAYRDYKDKGVEFYYIYKSLAHPEKSGHVQPLTLEERLKHIALAKEQLGTEIPWLADSMSNDLKHAFGDKNNSEFVVSPQGKIVISRAWSDPSTLRDDLKRLVGEPESVTPEENLSRGPAPSKYASGVVARVKRPPRMQPLVMKPHGSGAPETLYYVKPRVEAESGVLQGKAGKLYIGFHLDPIHRVHWNNLAEPLKFSLETPEGLKVNPREGVAPKVEKAEADIDPREFLLEIEGAGREPMKLKVEYFACDNDDRWCKAVTHEFEISFRIDRDGGRVSGSGRKPGDGKGEWQGKGKRKGRPKAEEIFERMDSDQDGKITKEEARGPMVHRFTQVDANEDGSVTLEELKARFNQNRR